MARALFADVFASSVAGPALEAHYQKVREKKMMQLPTQKVESGKSIKASKARHRQLMQFVQQPAQTYRGPTRRKRRRTIAS